MIGYGLFIAILIIMAIHFKTSNIKEISITWGLICFAIIIWLGNIWIAVLSGLSGYVVAWSIFSLTNYLEESVFLRIFILLFGMFALTKLPFALAELVMNLLTTILR